MPIPSGGAFTGTATGAMGREAGTTTGGTTGREAAEGGGAGAATGGTAGRLCTVETGGLTAETAGLNAAAAAFKVLCDGARGGGFWVATRGGFCVGARFEGRGGKVASYSARLLRRASVSYAAVRRVKMRSSGRR